MLVDLRVAQLLCSRLCHDLIGPVGAVNVGLELVDEGAEDAADALALVAESADRLSRRLAFYRAAFGFGGARTATLAEGRDLAAGLLEDGAVSLDWPPAASPIGQSGLKLLLNLVLLGVESLPRGGRLSVRFAELAEGIGVAVTAAGRGARFKDDLRAAMATDLAVEGLSAHTVHAHFTARLAEDIGTALEVSQTANDEVQLATLLPTADD